MSMSCLSLHLYNAIFIHLTHVPRENLCSRVANSKGAVKHVYASLVCDSVLIGSLYIVAPLCEWRSVFAVLCVLFRFV